jgi:hypothetical protein
MHAPVCYGGTGAISSILHRAPGAHILRMPVPTPNPRADTTGEHPAGMEYAYTRLLLCCCTFPGTAPYKVEEDREYVGHELAVLTQPDSAARSPAQCASACSRHQGRVRCSAWTFSRSPASSSAGNCTLRSSKGYEAAPSPGAVSGFLAGGRQDHVLCVTWFAWRMVCQCLATNLEHHVPLLSGSNCAGLL